LSKYTKSDIIKMIDDNNVKFIRLQFTDIFGSLKNVAITTSQIEKALDNKCMFDGSSIEGFVRIEESDMYLRPDLDSFVIFPWHTQHGSVARLICDVYKPDGTPFEGDPRYVLKKTMQEAEKMGYTFNVGPECEFFLFNTDEFGHATTVTHDTASYFDLGPSDLGEDARRDICLNLEEMGFEIEASHHEVAIAQHEIDFKYSEAMHSADNLITFKMVVQSVANSHGLCATFMPKPIYGESGSGMHTNMSLFKDGENVFYDSNSKSGLSHIAYNFIAGIMTHVKGMCAITNRSALIRVPATRGSGTRVELRSPDPACNPYLEFAVLLAAGLDGIKNNLTPPNPVSANIYDMSADERAANNIDNLPTDLSDAIKQLKSDSFIANVLGEHVFNKYVEAKEKEWNSFITTVTEWEIQEYLDI